MPLLENGRPLSGAIAEDCFSGKEIVCAIDLCDDMYGAHGLETGFNYHLLNKFAEDNRCNIKIISADRKENWIDSLQQGKADIVIMHDEEARNAAELNLSQHIDDCTVWAVKDEAQLHQINTWISHITSMDYYKDAKDTYRRTFNPYKRAERGIRSKTLSPYDEIIRKYAAELGWDWRMLAAVIYQESKFSINSTSHRGAKGLMQVMPRTANHYEIYDLLDPEQNIKAGTKHLKRLQRLYSKSGMESHALYTAYITFPLPLFGRGLPGWH